MTTPIELDKPTTATSWSRRLSLGRARRLDVGKVADLAVALAVGALVVILAVRFVVHAGPLWRDEVDAVNLSKMSAAALWRALDHMSLPPGYGLLLGLWSSLGWADENFGMRLFGLGTAIAVFAAIWIVGRRIGGRPPALALALFGANAIAIYTTASLTVYAPGTLLVVATIGAVWMLASAPRPATFLLAAGAALLAVQMQYQNLLHVAAAVLAATLASALAGRSRAAILTVAVGALAAASLLPYRAAVARSMAWRMLSRNPLNKENPLSQLADVLSVYDTPLLVAWVGIALLALYGLARMLSTVRSRTALGADPAVYAALTVIFAVGGVLILFRLTGPVVMPRHLVALVAVIAVTADVIIARLTPRSLRLATVAAVIAISFPMAWDRLNLRLTNVDLIGRHLEERARPGDLIVVSPWFMGVSFDRYYHGAARWTSIPPLSDYKNHRYDLFREQMLAKEPLAPLLGDIGRTLERRGRVWFVGGLYFLPAGQTPRPLPPPPAPGSAWFDSPYIVNWSEQTADFVRRHARRWYLVEIKADGPVSPTERPTLMMVEGWAGRAASAAR
jgi:hypothetical protein